MTNSGSGDLLV